MSRLTYFWPFVIHHPTVAIFFIDHGYSHEVTTHHAVTVALNRSTSSQESNETSKNVAKGDLRYRGATGIDNREQPQISANIHEFFPGSRLTRTGTSRVCHASGSKRLMRLRHAPWDEMIICHSFLQEPTGCTPFIHDAHDYITIFRTYIC